MVKPTLKMDNKMTLHTTPIFLSRKLEAIIPKSSIQLHEGLIDNPFGKWNATLFYVSRKKCLLFTNAKTRYSVFLPGLAKDDVQKLTRIFIETLIEQLKVDGISAPYLTIENAVGCLVLCRTDNDQKTIGTQNYILTYPKYWKPEFGDFSNWNFHELARRINTIPYEPLGWANPKDKMKELVLSL